LNASWRTRTANSVYFSSITQDIFISEVLIIMILIPSFARVEKNLAATPVWLRIPAPTIETLIIFLSAITEAAPNSFPTPCSISKAFFASDFETVKVRSALPSLLTFWIIISTIILASAMGLKIFAAMPGTSGIPVTVSLAASRL